MKILNLKGPPENWLAEAAAQEEIWHKEDLKRARNWGLVCGFGYGFAAATFAFIILLFVTAP